MCDGGVMDYRLVWYILGLLSLPAMWVALCLLVFLGFNWPSIERGERYRIVNFGIGQYITADAGIACEALRLGYRIHKAGGTFWALKILRWSI